MNTMVMSLYLIDGLTVGQIAKKTDSSAPQVRAMLRESGVRVRRVNQEDLPSRDPVCAAVHKKGFTSFHDFIQVHGLDSFGAQAKTLGVTEKAFVRVYESYRCLLGLLEASGRGVAAPRRKPTTR